MTVTWTSGYGINEAGAFFEWGPKGGNQVRSPAGTLSIVTACVVCKILTFEFCFIKNYLGVDTFAK